MQLIVPIQFFGIGDILWEQTLVKKIANGNPVLWPVESHFVEGLSRAYPDVVFVDRTKYPADYNRKDDYVENNIRYLPLRWTDSIMQVPYRNCMRSKYDFYNLDFRIWKEHAMWCRDAAKEDELYKLLGCDQGDYRIVNTAFGSFSQLQASFGFPEDGLRHISMRAIEGYSLFDWAKVIENASSIRTVSTSIIYLLEMLELKAPHVNLYCRKPIEHDFENIKYILEKHEYILHY